ncbi:riboflavin synthase [[Clostridium] symbiosum]|uniref:riboflavin synthase n=1 Tax=Clostridium symbiosum TaxID=1512 RepID=UPI001D079B81|nr:riboflavin synthase [[Clostridium] symbiosum]MCB6608827.1 riboflavin synthase [[Clostridium] symbiosum]MCB6929571.1 riboflavin synthase [[Clostridium] symbiosum]
MFTGIIEEVGTVDQIKRGQNSAVLSIRAKKVLEDTGIGDSIAVNGICLTVTKLYPDGFSADIMHETLNRSALAALARGSHVNLERAMPANGRFGGHIVAGHADGVGKIVRIQRDDTAIWFTFQVKPDIMRYIVEKGSVAIDGISLTVAAVTQTDFSISAIPHTVSRTVLKERKENDIVNLETDLIGRYVEKLFSPAEEQKKKNTLTREFLTQHGF